MKKKYYLHRTKPTEKANHNIKNWCNKFKIQMRKKGDPTSHTSSGNNEHIACKRIWQLRHLKDWEHMEK
jgi:hypothetical protein